MRLSSNLLRKFITEKDYYVNCIVYISRFGNTVTLTAAQRYTLKAILNRGYFRKMRPFSFFLSPLREEMRSWNSATFQRRKGSRRKVSATFHKHEINFNSPTRTAIRARKLCLFINSIRFLYEGRDVASCPLFPDMTNLLFVRKWKIKIIHIPLRHMYPLFTTFKKINVKLNILSSFINRGKISRIKHILSTSFQELPQIYFLPKPVTCERSDHFGKFNWTHARDCKLSRYRQGCQVGSTRGGIGPRRDGCERAR